jgi:hypothetical protein
MFEFRVSVVDGGFVLWCLCVGPTGAMITAYVLTSLTILFMVPCHPQSVGEE